jgi:hypothetical protein
MQNNSLNIKQVKIYMENTCEHIYELKDGISSFLLVRSSEVTCPKQIHHAKAKKILSLHKIRDRRTADGQVPNGIATLKIHRWPVGNSAVCEKGMTAKWMVHILLSRGIKSRCRGERGESQ